MLTARFAAAASLVLASACALGADDPRTEIRELKAKIDLLQASLEEARLSFESLRLEAEERKADLERSLAAAREEVERLMSERTRDFERVTAEIEQRESQISELRRRIAAMAKDYERSVGEFREAMRKAAEHDRTSRAALESSATAMRLAEPVLRRMVESGAAEDRFEAAAALDSADLLDQGSVAVLSTFLSSAAPDERRHAFRFFMGTGRYETCWPAIVAMFHADGAAADSRSEALSLLQESGVSSLAATAAAWAAVLPPDERLKAAELAAARGLGFSLDLFVGLLDAGGEVSAKALENLRCATREDFGADAEGIRAWREYVHECLAPTIIKTLEYADARRSLREKSVALSVTDLPAGEVARFLEDVGSPRIHFLSEDLRNAEVTIQLEDASLERAIAELARKAGGAFAFRQGICFVGASGEIERMDAPGRAARAWAADADVAELSAWLRLEARKVSLDFMDTPITDVIAFIAGVTKSNLYYLGPDDDEDMMVQLRVEAIPVSDALNLILALKGLARVARWGGIAIGMPDSLDSLRDLALPSDGPCSELAARLRTTVEDFDIRGRPLSAVFEYLAEAHGVMIETEDGLVLPAEPVTLRAWRLSLENLLNVLLVPRGIALKPSADGLRLTAFRAKNGR